jgi:2-oxoisovalerate dehydrogenase E1 component
LLFYIEDNGYGISVPSHFQTPGGDIAANLASFSGLSIFDGDGTDPPAAALLVDQAVSHVRRHRTPALLRLTVPRLEGHSAQDTEAYRGEEEVEAERARDPLPRLKAHCGLSEAGWQAIEREVAAEIAADVAEAEARGITAPESVAEGVYFEGKLQKVGGLWNSGYTPPASTEEPKPEGQRINMVTAIRRTLEQELASNPRVLLFGEDIGPKGGVHAVTLGLQEKFGHERVFDTSLNEEGIIGRAV